jgi:hypothetical protein
MTWGVSTRTRTFGRGLGALLLLAVWGAALTGCGAYGSLSRAGVTSGELDRILKNPRAYIAYASAPSRGVRAGEYVALFWDIRGDKFTLVPEEILSPRGHRWSRISEADVVRVYQGIVELNRQNETTRPVLYRVLSRNGQLMGYFFSASWGSGVAVIRIGPHRYSVRPVRIGEMPRNQGATFWDSDD